MANTSINWKKREGNLRRLAAWYRRRYDEAVQSGKDDNGWVCIPSGERAKVVPKDLLHLLDRLLVYAEYMDEPRAARNGALRLVDGDETRWGNHARPSSSRGYWLSPEPPEGWVEAAMDAWRAEEERRRTAGANAEEAVAGSPLAPVRGGPTRPPTKLQEAMAERWRGQEFKTLRAAAKGLTSPFPFEGRLAEQYRHLRFAWNEWEKARESHSWKSPADAENYAAALRKHGNPDGSFRVERKGNRIFHPFHNCPKALRKSLWSFDGEPVVEAWDMSSGAIRCMVDVVRDETPEEERRFLLSILQDPGRKLYREISAEAGLPDTMAGLVKTALLAYIHTTPKGYRAFARSGGRHSFLLPEGVWSEWRDKAEMAERKRAADAVEAFFRAHAPRTAEAFQNWGTMVVKNGVDRWGRETYKERRYSHFAWTAVEWERMSRLALSVLDSGLPCWTLHDAVWCRARDLAKVQAALAAAEPNLTTSLMYLSDVEGMQPYGGGMEGSHESRKSIQGEVVSMLFPIFQREVERCVEGCNEAADAAAEPVPA